MPDIIEPAEPDAARPSTLRRLVWFAGLALAGLAVTAAAAYALRALLYTSW